MVSMRIGGICIAALALVPSVLIAQGTVAAREAAVRLGDAAMAAEQWDIALREFANVRTFDREFEYGRLGLQACLTDHAIRNCPDPHTIGRESPDVLFNLGFASMKAGRYVPAIAWFQAYLVTRPSDADAVRQTIALLDVALENQAREFLTHASELVLAEPDYRSRNPALLVIARSFALLGYRAAAIDLIDTALVEFGSLVTELERGDSLRLYAHDEVQVLSAFLSASRGRVGEAEAILANVRQWRRGHLAIMRSLAEFYVAPRQCRVPDLLLSDPPGMARLAIVHRMDEAIERLTAQASFWQHVAAYAIPCFFDEERHLGKRACLTTVAHMLRSPLRTNAGDWLPDTESLFAELDRKCRVSSRSILTRDLADRAAWLSGFDDYRGPRSLAVKLERDPAGAWRLRAIYSDVFSPFWEQRIVAAAGMASVGSDIALQLDVSRQLNEGVDILRLLEGGIER